MRSHKAGLIAGSLLAPVLVAGALLAQTGAAAAGTGSAGHHRTLYVSKNASPSSAGRSCRSATFTTVRSALKAAPAWSTVVVCRGTYHEQVVITKPVSLAGQHATINEKGVTPTFTVNPPGVGPLTIFAGVVIVSSHVRVQGFTVKNALGEGILAAGVSGTIGDITIAHNAVVHNDLGGGVPPASSYFECQEQGQIPGDCGEGVHLLAVADSAVSGNFIAGNSGGVLLTDETGPTHNNVIQGNVITGNASDCGVTMPGHNPAALNSAGKRQPAVAGVYGNLVLGNVITNNGLKGEGAGVLFANAGPGTASYNNLVKGNYIAGNELSGVTFHAHTLGPGQFEDLSGNQVIGNKIGTNNLGGDPLDSPASPQDLKTTGVLVFSGGTTVRTVIAHNHIFDNSIGIWLSKPVKASGLRTNSFHHVKTPISAGH
jgi:nitrous oxidase accessory protein NosD